MTKLSVRLALVTALVVCAGAAAQTVVRLELPGGTVECSARVVEYDVAARVVTADCEAVFEDGFE